MPLRQYMRSFSHATIPNASSETGFAKVKHARYVHIRNAVACHAYDRLSLSAYPDRGLLVECAWPAHLVLLEYTILMQQVKAARSILHLRYSDSPSCGPGTDAISPSHVP